MIYLGMSEVQRKYQSGCSMTRRSGSGRNSSKKQSDAESGILSLHSQASNIAPEILAMDSYSCVLLK
jgi:hypothetical protein